MDITALIYYLVHLIKDGHEWQYKNINGNGERPKLYFSFLQYIAIVISAYFVIARPSGFSSATSDCILGCLSIMVALFMGLLIALYDKSNQIISKEQETVHKIHSWNFFYQFNALTSYAILLSIFVIVLVFVSLIFDVDINIFEYQFISPSKWTWNSILLFIKCFGVICIRFCILYFLIDFFIISLYAVCGIYQFMYLQYKKDEPNNTIYNETDIDTTFKEKYGYNIGYIKVSIIIISLIVLSLVFYKLIKMVFI